jgi:hypothetical protein
MLVPYLIRETIGANDNILKDFKREAVYAGPIEVET